MRVAKEGGTAVMQKSEGFLGEMAVFSRMIPWVDTSGLWNGTQYVCVVYFMINTFRCDFQMA